VQDFESESLAMGVEHSHMAKATPIASGYGSKDCAFWPAHLAVSRLNLETAHLVTEAFCLAPADCEFQLPQIDAIELSSLLLRHQFSQQLSPF
jgi:hypothetical protein